jgi:hypothetical protein
VSKKYGQHFPSDKEAFFAAVEPRAYSYRTFIKGTLAEIHEIHEMK